MTRLLLFLSAASLLLPASIGASVVRGRVIDVDGAPVAEAYVQARAGERNQIRAQARTDMDGCYVLETPAGPLQLEAVKTGYYVVEAGGLTAPTISKTCPEQGYCGDVDFVLSPAAVVEAWLADAYGDAVANVQVILADPPPHSENGSREAQGKMRAIAYSDDLGFVRFWDIPPGTYEVQVRDRNMGYPARGPGFHTDPVEVVIAPGETSSEVRIPLRSAGSVFTISGVVKDLPEPGDSVGYMVILRRKATAGNRPTSRSMQSLQDGRFTIPGMTTGDYVAQLVRFSRDGVPPEIRLLGELRVDGDKKDLEMAIAPKTGVTATFDFGTGERTNLDLQIAPAEGAGLADGLRLVQPAETAENTALPSGEYRLRLYSNDSYLAEDYVFRVEPGQMTQLTVRIGTEFAGLSGTVRMEAADDKVKAAHFTVGIKGRGLVRKVQADDQGRFVFEKLPPGVYVASAWTEPDIDVQSDAAWRNAESSSRELRLEPGFDVEIDLTAKP